LGALHVQTTEKDGASVSELKNSCDPSDVARVNSKSNTTMN